MSAGNRGRFKRSCAEAAENAAIRWPRFTRVLVRLWGLTYAAYPRRPRPLVVRLGNLLNCRMRTLARLGNGMTIEVVANDWVGLEIMTHGYYEAAAVELVSALLGPGMVFLDVGAHIGQYTLVASRIVGDQGEVHSFEPDPDTFELLTHNITRNGLKNVRANQVALYREDSVREFFRASPLNIGGSSLARPYEADSNVSFKVSCVRLDRYVEEHRLAHVDVIKMDIEGAEIDALRGAQKLLASESRPILVLEFHERALETFGGSCATLAEFLRARGYRLFDARLPLEEYKANPDQALVNVVALPATREAEIVQALARDRESIFA